MEIFPDLKDSPIFELTSLELTSLHEASLAKTKLLVDVGQRYARALETVYQTSHDFADAVESLGEHGGRHRDDSGLAGTPQTSVSMSRLVQSMREVSSFVELLRTQVELIVCDRLGSWAEEDHRLIQDSAKVAKARKAEYDVARGKYVNRMGEERMAAEEKRSMARGQVKAKRVASDEARLGLARALVESTARFEIEMTTSIASVMHAQKKYFEHGCAVGVAVDPHGMCHAWYPSYDLGHSHALRARFAPWPVDEILRRAGDLERDLEQRLVRFDEMVGYEMNTGDVTADAVPVQGELEALIEASFRSNNATVTILKQGFLLKRSSKRNKWDRRYFVLDSSGVLYYYSSKATAGSTANERVTGTPTSTVNLVTAAVKHGLDAGENASERQVPFTFRIVSPERNFILRAEEEEEAAAWMEVLQSVILVLLSSRAQFQPTVSPIKPTHSRDASQDLSRVLAAMELEDAAPLDAPQQTCADCGALPADWASINLMTRLCIECSGIHRKLGVHVSKVRSCNLDTVVWSDGAMLNTFEALGNDVINGIWEARLADMGVEKPTSSSETDVKESFVTKKYRDKAFISLEAAERRQDQAQVSKDLWAAIVKGDIVDVYQSLSILEECPKMPGAEAAALEAMVDGEGDLSTPQQAGGLQATHLHLAARVGDVRVISLLLQSGKFDIDDVDGSGRSALVYGLWFDNAAAALLLLKHGARIGPDFAGVTPLQSLRARGERSLRCNSDPALLELLMTITM